MERSAGILMPISSLPSPYGIGTLGKEAYRFVDFLQAAGCKVWQVFPLQDALFLGEEGRINSPAVVSDANWTYRFLRSEFSAPLRTKLYGLAQRSGRR